jgi:hypothetical protein
MDQTTQEIYEIGLEKFAGDGNLAQEFVEGFVKEAVNLTGLGEFLIGHAGKAVATGVTGLALGLGIHGVSSALNAAGTANLRAKYEEALRHVTSTNPLLGQADSAKIRSYGETIFKFAPHVAADPNLLSSILANAVHGEGIDPMTVKTLAELESRVIDSRKNSMFSPKSYV